MTDEARLRAKAEVYSADLSFRSAQYACRLGFATADAPYGPLREARAIADEAGLPLNIIDTNPFKTRRARSHLALTAEIAGYGPASRIITSVPQGDITMCFGIQAQACDAVAHHPSKRAATIARPRYLGIGF